MMGSAGGGEGEGAVKTWLSLLYVLRDLESV